MTQFNFSMSRAMTRPQGSDYFHSVLSTCSTFRPSQEDFCFLREKKRLFRTRIIKAEHPSNNFKQNNANTQALNLPNQKL